MHKRRYTLKELRGKLNKAGMSIEKISYYNTFLFLPAAVVRICGSFLVKQIEKILGLDRLPTSSLKMHNKWINGLLAFIFSLERLLITYMNFPFGFSIIAVVRKPASKRLKNGKMHPKNGQCCG
jgi:hypothetical protein